MVSPPTFSRSELIRALGDLIEPERRAGAIRRISELLGVETFVLFVHDSEIDKLLAAPGFPQTLPERDAWRSFLGSTRPGAFFRGSLPWPTAAAFMPAIGISLGERAAAIFLGGEPTLESLEEARELLQLITVGLTCERTLAFAAMQVQLARRATEESAALAASLDEARRAAQAEVAARKDAEQALREARDELARANADLEMRVRERTVKLEESVRELEAFSYTVSHDLRAPLRAMYGYADVLLKDAGARLSDEERGYLNRIGLAGRRLDRMIQDVLRYSRISQAEITLTPIALDRIVHTVIAEYPVLRTTATHIEVRSPLGQVLGHEMLLSQCIANLLLNAVKFVAPGVDPYVKVYTEKRGAIIRLWIADNGIGIEAQHMSRLFGMFERIHPSTSFEGNGIGLAIVKRAVHRLGGDVGVESVAARGSHFWLDLQSC
jgi:signal transduction histidine kinase